MRVRGATVAVLTVSALALAPRAMAVTVPPGWQVQTTATGVTGPASLAFPPAGSAFVAGLYVGYVDAAGSTGLVARVGAGGTLVQLGTFPITFPTGRSPIFRTTPSFDLVFDRPGGSYGGKLLVANGSLWSLAPAGGAATVYAGANQAAFEAASIEAKALIDGIAFGSDGLLRVSEGELTDELFRVSAAGVITREATRAGASDVNNPRLDRAGAYGGGLLFPQLFQSVDGDLDEVGGEVLGNAFATVLLSTATMTNPFGAAVGNGDAELTGLLYVSDFGPATTAFPQVADDEVYRLLPETAPPTAEVLASGFDFDLRGGNMTVGVGSDGLGSSLYVYDSATASIVELIPPRTGLLQITGSPATVASWSAVSGATAYDVVRGDLAALERTGSQIDLGNLLCIEDDSADLTTTGFADSQSPVSRAGFFYLLRFTAGGTPSDYGRSAAGLPRVPFSGGCSP